MPADLPPEIKTGLKSLRRRIRRFQLSRGLLRTFAVALSGLFVLVAVDFFLAPLPSTARAVLFFSWLAVITLAGLRFLLRPLMQKISLIRLARWLEERHPEVQERISTALELSHHPEGISPDLLAELSKDAASDVDSMDPTKEVRSERIRRPLWIASGLTVALIVLFVAWPREMGRLIARAVSPFSDLGNVGAFRFTIDPGDLEVLEGDGIVIDMTYEGDFDGALDFVVRKDGQDYTESLSPVSHEGKKHHFQYHLPSAEGGFRYFARVGKSESDQFEVRVWPSPVIREGRVRYQYPAYTGWGDQTSDLTGGVKALAGTEIRVTGIFDSPIQGGRVIADSKVLGELELDPSANGTKVSWSQTMVPETPGQVAMMVRHKLGRDIEGASFSMESQEDPAPKVKILTPVQREMKMRPDDQIVMTYEVIEAIGLGKAEIEIEAGGRKLEPLLELLPEKLPDSRPDLWSGEAMIYLGNLLPRINNPGEFKIRLALSDNRPAELDGPGVGYSEWISIKLDKNAPSLARQELQEQDSDLKKTVEKAISDVRKAQAKMQQAKSQLSKEEVPQKAQEALTESRDTLAKTEKDLADLSERMKQSIQAHRRDELQEAIDKVSQAREEVESAPLQDTDESRRAEIDSALRNADEAVQDLQELRNEVNKDHPKMDDLAKLEELAQKQSQLAREAAGNQEATPDRDWQKQQERLEEMIREQVRQSPEAKEAALRAGSAKAKNLAEEAKELKEGQKELAELVGQETPSGDELGQALAKEQEAIVADTRAELSEARQNNEERANDLPEAVAQAESALEGAQKDQLGEAAEAARKASRELGKGAGESAKQQDLQERQEQVAEAFEALAEGNTEEALAALEQMQADRGEELAQEVKNFVQADRDQLANARGQTEQGAIHAGKAAEENEAGKSPEAAKQNEQASQRFGQAEKALMEASENFAKQAAQAAQQQASDRKAPAPGEPLAEAFQESANAAQASESREAAKSAQAAADALQQAAQQARSGMAQGMKPGQAMEARAQEGKGQNAPGKGQGEDPQEGERPAQGNQGIPPQLARLGITAKDWEKIRATLKTDVSGSSGTVIPEDYRGLVKHYFEQVSKEQ